jgi:hypothetical protein
VIVMKRLFSLCCVLGVGSSFGHGQPTVASDGKYRILALSESGGHHIEFTKAAKPWLTKCGEENGFEVDYITNTAPITAAFLSRYRMVLQLDFVPYGGL